MMSAKPRLVVPYGLKTLLEGLSRAVLRIQPNSIAQFASTYFTELLHYRECHPALDIKDLVKDFQHQRVETWPEENQDICDMKRSSSVVTETVVQAAEVCGPLLEGRPPDDICATDQKPYVNREISNPDVCLPKGQIQRQMSVEKADVCEVKEEVKCTTGPIVPTPDDPWKCDEDVPAPASRPPSRPPSGPPSRPPSRPPSNPPSRPASRPASAEKHVEIKLEPPDSCPVEPEPLLKLEEIKKEPHDASPVESKPVSRPQTPSERPSPVSPAPEVPPRPVTPEVCIPKPASQPVSRPTSQPPSRPASRPPSQPPSRPPTPSDECKTPEPSPPKSPGIEECVVLTPPVPAPRSSPPPAPAPTPTTPPTPEVCPVPAPRRQPSPKAKDICPEPTYYEPPCEPTTAYVPAQENTMARIVRATSETYANVEPKLVQRVPEIGQATCTTPPYQTSANYMMDQGAPMYVEQIPQEILIPNQAGSRPPDRSSQGYGSPYPYQSIQSSAMQQACISDIPQQGLMANQGMMPKSDDPSNLWTLYRLTDLSQQKGGSSWDPRMQPMMQPMQRPQYMDQRMVNSPAYMISDDQKRRMAAPPYILVGSNVQEAHDWKAIPGHAVLSKNDLNPQRRYAAIPVPVAMNPDGCNQRMVSPNASPGHDMNAPGNPMYYSVAVPMDESQRMAAAQSYAHVGQEQRPPMTSYVNTPTLAVASAASRRPSASAVCDPRTARQGPPQ
ncbi:calcium-binding tyrosine phosphorylation-regulated protein isoform X2 [Pleurodeles waltl]|uniref:calcium-binding tyrosine phosphorylation-regulated protein isoform X2 n=1 Tax=Pleurodeles waltl TaxID=8319 RepID=UPI003709BEF8